MVFGTAAAAIARTASPTLPQATEYGARVECILGTIDPANGEKPTDFVSATSVRHIVLEGRHHRIGDTRAERVAAEVRLAV